MREVIIIVLMKKSMLPFVLLDIDRGKVMLLWIVYLDICHFLSFQYNHKQAKTWQNSK